MRLAIIFAVFFCSHLAYSQEIEQREIGKTIDKFLKYLSFSDTSLVRLDSLSIVFVPEGKLTANFGKKPFSYTVQQYVESIRSSIRSGQLLSSNERELARKVDIFWQNCACP
ncbi:hypothetical protein [Flavobacterium sp.]|uniref:hypothetical protein n=1 Tax=Flavobacterium sp. TaxID=239 RepID=UPI002B8C2B9A|nr:hypothetical protein [Flavobacterium sp.]HSD06643.1 hypothetical protein [Flavobacterium sp.]